MFHPEHQELCCDAIKPCWGDAKCAAAFDTYRTCRHDPAEVDKTGRYSKFGRTVRGDAGSMTRDALLTCIITSCNVCSGPDVF